MSGFSNSNSNRTFFGLFNGKFAIKSSEEEVKSSPNGVTRTNKIGNVVHELHYNEFSGVLCKIATEKHEEYGLQFVYQFIVDNSIYELKLSAKGRQAQAINFRLPNLQLDKEFTLHTFLDENENTVVWITQGNEKVTPFWTKDNPKELPPAVQKEFDGEKKWDFGAQRKYLMEYISTNIIPKLIKVDDNMLKAAQKQSVPTQEIVSDTTSSAKSTETPLEEETDDLPF